MYTRALLVGQDRRHLFVIPWRPHSPPHPQAEGKRSNDDRKGFRSSTLSSLPVTQEFNISPTFAHFRNDINAAGERALFQNRTFKNTSLQLIHTIGKIVQIWQDFIIK
jgi:hypothetical protein